MDQCFKEKLYEEWINKFWYVIIYGKGWVILVQMIGYKSSDNLRVDSKVKLLLFREIYFFVILVKSWIVGMCVLREGSKKKVGVKQLEEIKIYYKNEFGVICQFFMRYQEVNKKQMYRSQKVL